MELSICVDRPDPLLLMCVLSKDQGKDGRDGLQIRPNTPGLLSKAVLQALELTSLPHRVSSKNPTLVYRAGGPEDYRQAPAVTAVNQFPC